MGKRMWVAAVATALWIGGAVGTADGDLVTTPVQAEVVTARQTVEQWAQAVKTRNGHQQYDLLSKGLQRAVRKQMEGQYWVTGTSSPWIASYHVGVGKTNVDGSVEFVVSFTWRASAMSPQVGSAKLAVQQVGGEWKVVRTNWYTVNK